MILGAVALVQSCASDMDPDETAPDATTEQPDSDEPGARCEADAGPSSGEATYYNATGAGNCSFDAGGDLMVGAINGVDYDGAAWCGGCVEVTGPSGASVVVKIVDQCPGCAAGDIDLSREAFAAISPLSAGRIDIDWKPVACPVEGPMAYHFKDGSSESWTAIQVRNHKYPIAKLEAKTGADTWKPIKRLAYNYFVDPAGLAQDNTLRITDSRGQVVIEEGVQMGDDVTRTGQQQFATCR